MCIRLVCCGILERVLMRKIADDNSVANTKVVLHMCVIHHFRIIQIWNAVKKSNKIILQMDQHRHNSYSTYIGFQYAGRYSITNNHTHKKMLLYATILFHSMRYARKWKWNVSIKVNIPFFEIKTQALRAFSYAFYAMV